MPGTVKKPAHVKAWSYAEKHPDYRTRSDYTLEDACDRLIDEWLQHTHWKVTAFGREWEGELSQINYGCDVFFTLRCPDPEDPNRTLCIEAPFEQFTPIGKRD